MLRKAGMKSRQLPRLQKWEKEQVKAKCLNFCDEGNQEQSLDEWLGKEDQFSCAKLRLRKAYQTVCEAGLYGLRLAADWHTFWVS